jgi:hypothetical protein
VLEKRTKAFFQTLQSVIYKHIAVSEIVQGRRGKEKEGGEFKGCQVNTN